MTGDGDDQKIIKDIKMVKRCIQDLFIYLSNGLESTNTLPRNSNRQYRDFEAKANLLEKYKVVFSISTALLGFEAP